MHKVSLLFFLLLAVTRIFAAPAQTQDAPGDDAADSAAAQTTEAQPVDAAPTQSTPEPAAAGAGPKRVQGAAQSQSASSQADNSQSDESQAQPEAANQTSEAAEGAQRSSAADTQNPLVGQPERPGSIPFKRPDSGSVSLEQPDHIAEYIQQIRKPSLRITVDSVNEGVKKKNKNSFQDANIKIKKMNKTVSTRNGQVQVFEGPGFNMRTAVLTENNDDKSKSKVVTKTDTERNFTRNRDRLTQFVGTLNTDEFSSGALLTDHANRGISGSVRQTVDGNRETHLKKQSRNSLTRGSFLKAANLSIKARYQSDSFSNREHQVSDLILGGSLGLGDSASDDSQDQAPAAASGSASAGSASAESDDQQDD